jgi:hypothetical protein
MHEMSNETDDRAHADGRRRTVQPAAVRRAGMA